MVGLGLKLEDSLRVVVVSEKMHDSFFLFVSLSISLFYWLGITFASFVALAFFLSGRLTERDYYERNPWVVVLFIFSGKMTNLLYLYEIMINKCLLLCGI